MPRKNQNTGNLLPGQPGYRNRAGRFGLDPLDTSSENARMEGMFLQRLFTLRLRSRDPFHLGLMLVFGIITSAIILPILGLIFAPNSGDWDIGIFLGLGLAYLILGFIFLVGVLLLINFGRNMLEIFRRPKTGPGKKKINPRSNRK